MDMLLNKLTKFKYRRHYHHHHHQVTLTTWISLTLFLYPSVLAGLPNYILCPHRANVNKFLLVNQHWHDKLKESIGERHL